mmetsp:Transcript_26222/g.81645  ORF Transcript_26222/g.81645 Transcript_26222/m.81645 type:complete len:170 (-) Transcript_26222:31-540(-)
MMRRTALVCCCVGATSLAPTTRRQWLQRASAAAIAVPTAASAGSKLEDGLALPDGAAQFQHFRDVQGEWTRFGERLSRENIDDKEWSGVPLLLRRVYDAGDDMIFMSKGLDAAKRETAKKLASDFRSGIKNADRPAQAKDRDAVISAYRATAPLLSGFLDLTSDVPAEL